MTRRRLFAGAAAVGYSKLVVIVTQLAMVPALAHGWGLALYGQWILLSTIPTFLAAGDFGFGTVASNRLIGEVAKDERDAALTTFQTGLAVVLSLSTALLALAMIAALALPATIFEVEGGLAVGDVRLTLILLAVGGIVALQRGLFMGVSRAVRQFARTTMFDTTFSLIEAVAIISVALSGGGLVAAAIAFLVVRICATVGLASLALYQARWLRLGFGRASLSLAREMTRPSLAVMLYPLANAGLLQGTAIAVGVAGGAALVPVYNSLRTLARTGLQFLQAISLPVAPEYTAAAARGDRAHADRLAGMLATFSIVGALGFAAGFALFGEFVLHLWTKGAIVAPGSAVMVFAASVALGAVWPQLVNLLFAVNRHEGFTLWFAASVLPAVALTYVLVRHMGVTGGAVSYFLVDLSMTIAIYVLMRRQGRWPRIGWAPVVEVLGQRHEPFGR